QYHMMFGQLPFILLLLALISFSAITASSERSSEERRRVRLHPRSSNELRHMVVLGRGGSSEEHMRGWGGCICIRVRY
ncbi:hypothetical protein PMAYCL1PPCAC_16501, partial [Pristionchus mayeri]